MPAAPKNSRNLVAALVGMVAMSFATHADAGPERNRVRSVKHNQVGSATSVTVVGSKTPTFSVYKLEGPERVVVDLANATIDPRIRGMSGGKSVFDMNTWAVSQVSAHEVAGSRRAIVRIVVRLARTGSYRVKAVGSDLRIQVTPRQAKPAQPDGKASAAAVKAAKRDADRRVAAARAEANRIKAVLAAARAEAARARASLKVAKADADQAKRDAAQSRQRAKQATDNAKRAVAHAQDEARKAKQLSRQRLHAAKQQLAAASSKLARAQTIMTKADADKRMAQKARLAAASDASRAKQRLSAAAAAELRANAQKADAARAADRAAKLRAEARRISSTNSARANRLQQQAAAATADAQQRKARAEAALKSAEARRKQAIAAAKAAEDRRLRAIAALKSAQAKRDLADRQRRMANAGKVQAESQWKLAEARRQKALRAADEAHKRAARAKALLAQEQAALARTRKARAAAANQRVAAKQANVRLEASLTAVTRAKATADRHRKAAAVAAKQLKALSRDRAASKRAIADARAKAQRLTQRASKAEALLADRMKQVDQHRTEVRRLAKQRDAFATELAKLRKDARKARTLRLAEEAKLAALSKQRVQAEAQLRRVQKAQKDARAQQKKLAADARAQQKKLTARARAQQKRLAARPRVRDVDFVDKRDTARVVIALSSPAKPRVIRRRGRRLVLEIPNTSITKKLERTLDTTRFRGPVRAVSSYRDPGNANNVRVVVDLARSAKGELVRVGNTYYWDFRKTAKAPKPTVARAASPRRSTRTRATSYRTPVVGGYGTVSTPITQHTVAQLRGRNQRRVYRGRKIDLDFKDADIHNLLRLLADVGAVNIVVPDSIKAKVTVRLKRVPWDQALEVILSSKGLWYRRVGNLYRVAPRKELDTEDENEAKRLKLLAGSEAPEPEVFTLNYADAGEAKKQLEPLLSPKGKIEVDKRTNALIINDIRAHRRRIIALIRRLDTQTPQIQIEARIVEARSTYVRQIGVQWGGTATASQATGNATGLIFPNSVGVFGATTQGQTQQATGDNPLPSDFAVSLPAAVGTGSGGALGFTLGSVGGNFSLNLRLSALEDQGTVRVISSPKITVINNEAAEIKQGTSVPISVPAANGTGTQTTFVPADLSLKVTPQVSQRDCSITMKLEIKNNEIGPVTAQGESILTKEAKTTLLINDGQTTVVGGVYTRNTGLTYSKVPFFGDLPVVGWFFKSRRESDDRAELLIFITPRITNKAFLRCE